VLDNFIQFRNNCIKFSTDDYTKREHYYVNLRGTKYLTCMTLELNRFNNYTVFHCSTLLLCTSTTLTKNLNYVLAWRRKSTAQ